MTDMKSLEPTDYPSVDWLFFRNNPDRRYYVRLATAAEIAQHDFLDPARLPPDCFFYAVSRLKRAQALELQTVFVVLEPQGDMDEADCMAAWDAAEDALVGGHVEMVKQ